MYRTYNEIGNSKPSNNVYPVMSVQNREHRMDIIKKNLIVCIKIGAEWCKPCKQIAPDYAVMANEYAKKGACICVEEDLGNGIRDEFPIDAVPTFLIFCRGQLVSSIQGTKLDDLREKIDEILEKINQQPQNIQEAPVGYAQKGNDPLYRQNYGQQPHPGSNPSFYR